MILKSFIFLISLVFLIEFLLRLKLKKSKYYVFLRGRKERLKPVKELHPTLEAEINFSINSDGERGAEFDPTSKRILIVGGSSVESYFIDQKSTWSEVLKVKLEQTSKSGERFHVGNIGKSGFDSKTLAFDLKKIKPNYQSLDLILIMVGASDVLRWLEIDAPIDRGAEDLRNDEIFSEYPINSFTIRHSAIARSYNFWSWRQYKVKLEAGKWYKRARMMRRNSSETILEVPNSKTIENLFEKYLTECIIISKSFAKEVYVIRQPWFNKPDVSETELAVFWNGGVGKAYKEEIKKYYSHLVISELMQRLDDVATKVCLKNELQNIDLKPFIESNLINYTDQFHFTKIGSEIIGQRIFEIIKKNNF